MEETKKEKIEKLDVGNDVQKHLFTSCGIVGESPLKRMCLNCSFNVNGYCDNSNNLKKAKEKMLTAAKAAVSSYEIDSFEIKPLPLKKPELSCGEWNLHDSVRDNIELLFV